MSNFNLSEGSFLALLDNVTVLQVVGGEVDRVLGVERSQLGSCMRCRRLVAAPGQELCARCARVIASL